MMDLKCVQIFCLVVRIEFVIFSEFRGDLLFIVGAVIL